MKAIKDRFRRGSVILMKEGKIKTWYTVETIMTGRWLPVGDNTGMFRFATKQEADAKLTELQENIS